MSFFIQKAPIIPPLVTEFRQTWKTLEILKTGKPGKQWNLVTNYIPGKNREKFLKEFFVSHIF